MFFVVTRSHRFDQSLCVTRTPHFRFYQFCHWFWEMVSSLKVLFSIFYWSNLDFWKTQSIDFSLKSPKSLTFPGFDQFFIENSALVLQLGVVVRSRWPLAAARGGRQALLFVRSGCCCCCGCCCLMRLLPLLLQRRRRRRRQKQPRLHVTSS